jgi:hypothetical protein
MYLFQPSVADVNKPKELVVIEDYQMVISINISMKAVVQTAVGETVTAL